MRYFVTGATGFIGLALVKKLINEGHEVKALVRRKSGKLPKGVIEIKGDLKNLTNLNKNVFKNIDTIIHLAAIAHKITRKRASGQLEYTQINRDSTVALAKQAAQYQVRRFLFLSTVKVNGEFTPPNMAFDHQSKANPTDEYARSKYEAEKILLQISKETDMEIVIIRPPLVYGPGVKANFLDMIQFLSKGWPLPFGSINNKRSLVALDNLIDFINLCANSTDSPKAANKIFLISDGRDISTRQLIEMIGKVFRFKIILIPIPVFLLRLAAMLLGKNEIAKRLINNLQIDTSETHKLLGWKPVTTMERELERMLELERG